MNTGSPSRFFAAALCVAGAFGISLSAVAGDGVDCPEKAARMEAEGGAHGQISASEHAANAHKRFEAMDTDHDGKVTAAEFTSAQGAERIAWARTSMSGADKVKAFDRNKDGVLSAKEYSEGSQAIFDKLDTNSDGYLKADEIEAKADRMSAR